MKSNNNNKIQQQKNRKYEKKLKTSLNISYNIYFSGFCLIFCRGKYFSFSPPTTAAQKKN